MVRHSLHQLAGRKLEVILCFDEVDLLQTVESEGHDLLVAFLESLLGEAPTLLLGQTCTLPTKTFCPLSELTSSELRQLLQDAGLKLTPTDFDLVYAYTGGNPRLADLMVAFALIYEDRGAYILAAFHLIKAGQTERAIALWRQQCSLLCADLSRLLGQSLQALRDLQSTLWSTPLLAMDAAILQGKIANKESRLHDAKRYF